MSKALNNELREVRINLWVCPGCDKEIDGLAKVVDSWAYHDLNCMDKHLEKKPISERTK